MKSINSVSVFSNDYVFIKICLTLNVKKIYVFSEKDKNITNIKELSNDNRCRFYQIDKSTLCPNVPKVDIGLMFGFGIQLTGGIINKHNKGVVNVHPGSLKLYRGRHPLGWALIERQAKVTLTFHKITEDFDLGMIIKEIDISVNSLDTEKKLIDKVYLCFSKATFEKLLNEAGSKIKREIIDSGRYLPSLAGKFEDIKSIDFPSEMLIGISRAKFDYGGILLNNHNVGLLYAEIDKSHQVEMIRFKCSDNRYVYSNGENNVLTTKK